MALRSVARPVEYYSIGEADSHDDQATHDFELCFDEFNVHRDGESDKCPDNEDLELQQNLIIEDFLGTLAGDTAAAMEHLDLVITVDTAVAHLAGAMGRPVWVLLPFAPDWRWMLHREDSPWYPSMRLFRQERPGDWESVFRKVVMELERVSTKHNK